MSIENVKKILKKAISLDDQELIEMAQKMLEDINSKSKPKPDIESQKTKKRGRPKKVKVTEKKEEKEDFSIKRNESNKIRKKYDDEGNEIGTFTRPRPINKFSNSFKDDKKEFKEDTKIMKKIKVTKSERRPPAKPKKVICNNCEKKFETFIEETTCSNCLKRMAGGRSGS